MYRQFREFAVRGNVIDLAVGIVIGAAFSGIVSSFVDNVLMPVIGVATGGLDFSQQYLLLKQGAMPGPYLTLEMAKAAGAVVLGYGAFVNALVHFVIVAFALFLIVKGMNAARRPQAPGPIVATREEVLLTEIRDLLARR